MTKLDKMRQKQSLAPTAPSATPIGNTQTNVTVPRREPLPVARLSIKEAVQAIVNEQQPKEKKPPADKVVIGYEPLAHACGHVLPFKLYAEPDAHRDARRQKRAGQKCSDCRVKEHNAQQEARAAQNPNSKRARDGDGRLPDGSSFTPAPVYDAAAKQWSGGLRIGKEGEDGPTFETTASGVMGLFRALDLQYRAFLRREVATTETPPDVDASAGP